MDEIVKEKRGGEGGMQSKKGMSGREEANVPQSSCHGHYCYQFYSGRQP